MSNLAMRIASLARATNNAGVTHIFLGDALSHGCDKTTVEPGNNFSPGIATFGVSFWIEVEGELYSPDLMSSSEFDWGFDNGSPPVIRSAYSAGGQVDIINRIGHCGGEGSNGADFVEICVHPINPVPFVSAIVVRDTGPAGAKIDELHWDQETKTLSVNQTAHLVFETAPHRVEIMPATGEWDSPIAIVIFMVLEKDRLTFKCIHGFRGTAIYDVAPVSDDLTSLNVSQGLQKNQERWQQDLPARIACPDACLVRAYEASVYHILAAMECGLPRISVVNYPIFWIRDCVLVLRALDLIGRHDLARIGCDYLAPLIFGGGFGAEADAPGEGVWALVNHAQMTGDSVWLKSVYPEILRRIDWITRMVSTTKTISWVSENRTPAHMLTPDDFVVCLPAKNGTIDGRMDGHRPNFYINCWAICGLRMGSKAAIALGDTDRASAMTATADELEYQVSLSLLPRYGNERDTIVTPHPTKALSGNFDELRQYFRQWLIQNAPSLSLEGLPNLPWPYFDIAQVHNAFLLGLSDIGWVGLESLIEEVAGHSVHSFAEGYLHEKMPYKNTETIRGWLNPTKCGQGNMPHNWASAEMILLIRDLFVQELPSGEIVLGPGIRQEWLQPNTQFGITAMPTSRGLVSYRVETDAAGKRTLTYSGPQNPAFAFYIDEFYEELTV